MCLFRSIAQRKVHTVLYLTQETLTGTPDDTTVFQAAGERAAGSFRSQQRTDN